MATGIMAYESKRNTSSASESPSGFPVFEKLRPQLATLMGHGGFRALVTRALTLARAEVHWLRRVHVKLDGSLEVSGDQKARISKEQIAEGRIVLLAQLLGLLVAFIGESLTRQLVRELWPKAPIKDGDFGNESKNEKA